MTNMKNKLKSEFNRQKNYEGIIMKIERKNDMRKTYIFKYALVPLCLVVIITSIFLFNNRDELKRFETDKGSKIVINKSEDIGESILDIDAKIDTEGEFLGHDFINNIKIPNDLELSSKYLVYTKPWSENYDPNATYSELHDYVMNYETEPTSNGIVEKTIIIAFSENFKPLRCIVIESDDLEPSKIKDTKLEILGFEGMYIAKFNYNGLNFDIETRGISENELIELLESIII